MKLYFENNQGESERYELPDDFKPSFSPYRRRNIYKPRYSKDGAVSIGDGRINSRDISFSYMLTSGDEVATKQLKDTAYRDALSDIISFFRPALSPFFLIDTDALGGEGLRSEVDFKESDDKNQNGLAMRIGNNVLKLEMISGHWEDADLVIEEDTGGISNGAEFDINNTGPLESYPIYTFVALDNVVTITLRNQTNGQSFTYSNTTFTAGSTLILDTSGEEFLVTQDGIDTGFSLSEGSGPIQLEPGVNSFLYESTGIVTYDIQYRRKYPI